VVEDLVCHELQLLLLGLLWLGMLLYGLWPWLQAAAGQAHRQPAKQAKRRSPDPRPFAGLTHKPCCEACEYA
jgi:hypothetical protein